MVIRGGEIARRVKRTSCDQFCTVGTTVVVDGWFPVARGASVAQSVTAVVFVIVGGPFGQVSGAVIIARCWGLSVATRVVRNVILLVVRPTGALEAWAVAILYITEIYLGMYFWNTKFRVWNLSGCWHRLGPELGYFSPVVVVGFCRRSSLNQHSQ